MAKNITKTPKPKAGKSAKLPRQQKHNLGTKPSKQRKTLREEKP
jgi:hypothetical protein